MFLKLSRVSGGLDASSVMFLPIIFASALISCKLSKSVHELLRMSTVVYCTWESRV